MYRINKGVDRPPEVMGIRGMRTLMILGGGAISLLLVTVLVIAATGMSAGIGFSGFLIAVLVLYQQMSSYSRKYGERGFAKFQSNKRIPTLITSRSSGVFRQLREDAHRVASLPLTEENDE